MLHAVRLHDFRSFADSGRIELADVNVFIGPNSAGKSNIMTAIELGLLSTRPGQHSPLPLSQVSSFGSFDSVLRRPGQRRARKDAELALGYDWDEYGARYFLRRAPSSGAAIVQRAEYFAHETPDKIVAAVEASDAEGGKYRKPGVAKKGDFVAFGGGSPGFFRERGTRFELTDVVSLGEHGDTVIVRPHRPVPRSVYVLDDPMMHADDSQLIRDLLRLWSDDAHSEARETIVENLRAMKLAVGVEARTLGGRKGPLTAEIRVSPRRKSETATLADVGYGVSQILPLLSHDAQLSKGNLVAYQPEAHLHPLAQSRLADVFVASAGRGNKVYVETHSEHLVMRLQTLVAAGLDPARVRVFCVEHDGKQSVVTTMAFDKQGIPTARWPKGFLDTGLELARDLAEQRKRSR